MIFHAISHHQQVGTILTSDGGEFSLTHSAPAKGQCTVLVDRCGHALKSFDGPTALIDAMEFCGSIARAVRQ